MKPNKRTSEEVTRHLVREGRRVSRSIWIAYVAAFCGHRHRQNFEPADDNASLFIPRVSR